MKKVLFVVFCALYTAIGTRAQLSQNPNKFLGNITTSYSVDAGGGVPQFYKLWNQITCENESKWSSVEGSRGNFNWNGADNAFNYAKNHGFTYKFHALVWGAQYPGWLENLSPAERFAAYVNWFDHAKEHYGTLPMIDVVNEAVGNHQAGNPMVKESLGGGGKTGYDWLIKAFEMAYERWPDAILIYNDFNSIRWDIDNYITLVRTLRDAGAPIDAYGNQAHELGGCSQSELQTNLKKQQDALLMPMFITEYDIGDANDGNQSWNYQQHFPVMWELPYCAGVTLWGYVYGKTWTTDGNSGLYKNGVERPAMTWLKEYMATDAAKNAAGPFPGTKKEASIYIRPAALKYAVNDPLPIKVRAKMATKTIAKIDLYANDDLIATMTEEPYVTEYTAATSGTKTLKAVVTTTDGATYERYSRVTISRGAKREPYNETLPELPGTIKAEEFDKGMDGVTYSKVSSTRTSFAQTATKDGAWMEYTVDVKEEGYYTMEMEVASASDGGRFHLAEYGMDNLTFLTSFTDVPKTGSTTDFKVIKCSIKEPLSAGRHVLTFLVDKGGFYVKNMTFKHTPTFSLPGVVETEDFLRGGEGIDVISTNNGYVISNTDNGEWLEYSVDVTQAGKYSYEATVSSEVSTSKFSMVMIEEDGTEKTLITVNVPQTGKNTYQVKSGKIRNALKAGKQKLRVNITGAGCNIDKINFVCTEPTGINDVMNDDQVSGATYNLSGQKVSEGYKGILIINGKKVVIK